MIDTNEGYPGGNTEMIQFEWKKDYEKGDYIVHDCVIYIDIPLPKSMCLYITAHYNDGRPSMVQPWIDARGESSTFYQRADKQMKEKFPGAIYAYRAATDEETERMNNEMWEQVYTWTGDKSCTV